MLLKLKKLLTSGSEIKRRSKLRRHVDSNNENDSDFNSSSIFVLAKKKGRQHARDAKSFNNDDSSGNDLNDRRKQSRKLKTKRNSKTKKMKFIRSNN
jgi:hypothetical protein